MEYSNIPHSLSSSGPGDRVDVKAPGNHTGATAPTPPTLQNLLNQEEFRRVSAGRDVARDFKSMLSIVMLATNGGKEPTARTSVHQQAAPYRVPKDSRGRKAYWIWKTAMDDIPEPHRGRIQARYPGCCDNIDAEDWSTLRKHQFSTKHANELKPEDLQYIPIGLCPAFPQDLGCHDVGQRIDIYKQKGRHFDSCLAYQVLCSETKTEPPPLLTNRAAVLKLKHERNVLRALSGRSFAVPSTHPISPLPFTPNPLPGQGGNSAGIFDRAPALLIPPLPTIPSAPPPSPPPATQPPPLTRSSTRASSVDEPVELPQQNIIQPPPTPVQSPEVPPEEMASMDPQVPDNGAESWWSFPILPDTLTSYALARGVEEETTPFLCPPEPENGFDNGSNEDLTTLMPLSNAKPQADPFDFHFDSVVDAPISDFLGETARPLHGTVECTTPETLKVDTVPAPPCDVPGLFPPTDPFSIPPLDLSFFSDALREPPDDPVVYSSSFFKPNRLF